MDLGKPPTCSPIREEEELKDLEKELEADLFTPWKTLFSVTK